MKSNILLVAALLCSAAAARADEPRKVEARTTGVTVVSPDKAPPLPGQRPAPRREGDLLRPGGTTKPTSPPGDKAPDKAPDKAAADKTADKTAADKAANKTTERVAADRADERRQELRESREAMTDTHARASVGGVCQSPQTVR